jgi:DnaJ-class molecular chaperone
MTTKPKCAVCNGNGTTFVAGKYVRCKHCLGRDVVESPKIVGYANAAPIKKKESAKEEIERDWR